jgi:hypothetical protein
MMAMKYNKQMMDMAKELNGVYVDAGFMVNGYYVETSSVTNIYKDYELIKSYKTPKSAVNWLKKN